MQAAFPFSTVQSRPACGRLILDSQMIVVCYLAPTPPRVHQAAPRSTGGLSGIRRDACLSACTASKVTAELSPGSTANRRWVSPTQTPRPCVQEKPGVGHSGAGSSGTPPPDRANRLTAKGRQTEKVLPQAAETAVIYTHLYETTSKGDEKREATGCRSNWSVAEIKADAMCHHLPLPASAPTDILAWKGSPGGN